MVSHSVIITFQHLPNTVVQPLNIARIDVAKVFSLERSYNSQFCAVYYRKKQPGKM